MNFNIGQKIPFCLVLNIYFVLFLTVEGGGEDRKYLGVTQRFVEK